MISVKIYALIVKASNQKKPKNQSETCCLLKLEAVEVKTEAKFRLDGPEYSPGPMFQNMKRIKLPSRPALCREKCFY